MGEICNYDRQTKLWNRYVAYSGNVYDSGYTYINERECI